MKKILVIGGGFAGSYIAKKLEKKFDVTLVDTKDLKELDLHSLKNWHRPLL